MAGPVASVIVPRKFSEDDKNEIRSTIKRYRSCRIGDKSSVDFWIQDRPFLLGFGIAEYETMEFEDTVIADIFGWTPNDKVTFSAMCNQNIDHRLLGELCLLFARKLSGLVDFCGALGPVDDQTAKLWEIGDHSLEAWWPHFDRLFSGMPGTIHSIADCNGNCVQHFGDATFLEAWLRHPNFQMIK